MPCAPQHGLTLVLHHIFTSFNFQFNDMALSIADLSLPTLQNEFYISGKVIGSPTSKHTDQPIFTARQELSN